MVYFPNIFSKGNKIQEIMQQATSQDDLFLFHHIEKLQVLPHKEKLIFYLIELRGKTFWKETR